MDVVFKEKAADFTRFKCSVSYRINLKMRSIMRPIYICSAVSRVYPRRVLYEVIYLKKVRRSDFENWKL